MVRHDTSVSAAMPDIRLAVSTGDQPFLMSVRNDIIFGISLDPAVKGNDAMVPIAGIRNGFNVEFDDSEQFIYWAENPVSCMRSMYMAIILRQNPSGISRKTFDAALGGLGFHRANVSSVSFSFMEASFHLPEWG